MYINIYKHMYIHIYIHAYIFTYIHIQVVHTQSMKAGESNSFGATQAATNNKISDQSEIKLKKVMIQGTTHPTPPQHSTAQ